MATARWNRSATVLAAVGGLLLSAGAFAGNPQTSWDNEMQMMDANRDGKISATEHAAGAKKMFDAMDANKDGKVTAAEMDAGRKKMKGEGTGGKASHHEMSSAEKISVVDLNRDGILSAEEHDKGSRDMFGKMDADEDGSVTAAEVKAGHEKMMSSKEGRSHEG